jgi:hypothetical protein
MPNSKPPSRLLTSCRRGPAELRPVLHLAYPASARSTLELKLAPGVTCEVLLAPRYTLFLLVLADAWNKDEGRIETQRGFRTNAELGECLRNPSKHTPVTEETVRAYVREIRAKIKQAVASLCLRDRRRLRIPALIENAPNTGYRIGACGLETLQPRASLVLTI